MGTCPGILARGLQESYKGCISYGDPQTFCCKEKVLLMCMMCLRSFVLARDQSLTTVLKESHVEMALAVQGSREAWVELALLERR